MEYMREMQLYRMNESVQSLSIIMSPPLRQFAEVEDKKARPALQRRKCTYHLNIHQFENFI